MSDRIVAPARIDEDVQYEAGLRPRSLDDYIGQDRIRENLQVAIAAARNRGEALDHALLYGPPGLGKTTLATVIANELGVSIRSTAGPVIERPGDLAAILTALGEREVLFIDEIHRLAPAIEEILYPAMEDFELDIVIGQGPGARSVKVPLQPFTLIGATTRAGLLTSPLRARFGIVHRLDFYADADIEEIVRRSARISFFKSSKNNAIVRSCLSKLTNDDRYRLRSFSRFSGKSSSTPPPTRYSSRLKWA